MRLLVINYKEYPEVSGLQGIELAKASEELSKKYGVKIAVAPSTNAIAGIREASSLPVFSQYIEDSNLLRRLGVYGSLINHSDHPVPGEKIARWVEELREMDLTSIVCVTTTEDAAKYALLQPTYVAVEPKELIGTGRAVSKERPELITAVAEAIKSARNSTKLLCGAGIMTGEDVSKAIELGAEGVLVASGIVKAKNPKQRVEEFAAAMMKSLPR